MTDITQNNDNGVPTASVEPGGLNIEWSYAGKALRAQALLFALISLLLVGAGGWATFAEWQYNNYLIIWLVILGCLTLLWGYHYTVYFYRTRTIRYRLTDRHLYAYRGLFTHTSDTMELIHINDIRLVRTLFDRLFNGGVGSLVIYCAVDKTHEELVLKGIDKPIEIFEKIDALRTAMRTQRAIITGGS